ncbi:alpha/beta hydrolase [Lactobacillaceae bacterium L1_55_11]|nr:alpha/beta hydrolase [Lactobacillaceae bacterium L1_55_11]
MLFKDRPYQFQPATLPESVDQVITDLRYAPGDKHLVDLYLPKGSGPFPVVIDIHGGGLLRGRKSSNKAEPSLKFTAAGFAVVSMGYTLNRAGANDFPNQVAEVRAVCDLCQQVAEQYNLDMDQLNLVGESSGAQLAVLAAATFSKSVALGSLPGVSFGSTFPKISHVIGLYGPYQVDQFPEQFAALGIEPNFPETGGPESFEGIMMDEHRPSEVPDLVAAANPATYFTKQMPTLMLIAGTADAVVPYVQSVNLAKAYEEKTGRPATTIWVPGGHHGTADFDNPEIYQAKVEFLES